MSAVRTLRILDDQWSTVALGAVSFGTIAALLGFITAGGFILVLIGFASALIGIWIFGRPVGIVIDSESRAMVIRGLVGESNRRFDQVRDVAIRQSVWITPGLPIAADPDERYDVWLIFRDGVEVILRRDLGLKGATAETARIRALIWPSNAAH
jgi:hypothetical protein